MAFSLRSLYRARENEEKEEEVRCPIIDQLMDYQIVVEAYRVKALCS